METTFFFPPSKPRRQHTHRRTFGRSYIHGLKRVVSSRRPPHSILGVIGSFVHPRILCFRRGVALPDLGGEGGEGGEIPSSTNRHRWFPSKLPRTLESSAGGTWVSLGGPTTSLLRQGSRCRPDSSTASLPSDVAWTATRASTLIGTPHGGPWPWHRWKTGRLRIFTLARGHGSRGEVSGHLEVTGPRDGRIARHFGLFPFFFFFYSWPVPSPGIMIRITALLLVRYTDSSKPLLADPAAMSHSAVGLRQPSRPQAGCSAWGPTVVWSLPLNTCLMLV